MRTGVANVAAVPFPFVFFLITPAVAVAGYFASARRREAHIARAQELATRYGFVVDVEVKAPPWQPFDLFERGGRRTVTTQFWRDGTSHSVFEYSYQTGSGKSRRTHRHTCALIALPFVAPHTKIGPERFWSGIGETVGIRDIEVESPRFNEWYRVTSDDERFAVTMLDGRANDWLPDNSGHVTSSIRFVDTWMLFIAGQLDLEQMFGFLDWAQSFPAQLPDVLPRSIPVADVGNL